MPCVDRRNTPHHAPRLLCQPREGFEPPLASAAKVRGKNRTDFILDAARSAAEETLLDQALLVVSPEAYSEFVARLDRAPAPNARLKETLQTPAPWDKQ